MDADVKINQTSDTTISRVICRYVRAANYSSMDKFKYFKSANEETMIIAHIEGVEDASHIWGKDTIETLPSNTNSSGFSILICL